MATRPFSPRVLDAVKDLEPGLDPLKVARHLRKVLDADEARAAAQLHDLRSRARGKLAHAASLLLTRKGLEQASDRRVAAARAEAVVARGGGRWIWDATVGMGSDAGALADAGMTVLASDRDTTAARMAHENLRARAKVAVADALRPPLLSPSNGLVLLDPDRRTGEIAAGGRRIGRPDGWSPSLEACLDVAARFAGAALKLPPALDADRVPLAPTQPHAWRWVSLAGELKELCLWSGCLATAAPAREALVIPAKGASASLNGGMEDRAALDDEQAMATPWILDPDPAVVRSGLLGALAARIDAHPLHRRLAYLGSPERPQTPFGRSYRVLGTAPLDRRRVRRLLSEHDVGPLTVKKRGHPDSSESLAARLRGGGSRRGLLLVARLERGHLAYLVEPTLNDEANAP